MSEIIEKQQKLASIEKILETQPIAGADFIVQATVLGFSCVVKKDEFKPGDFTIFHAPDTIADSENPQYEFLRKNNWRIKQCKFKNVRSQGLCLPLSTFDIKLEEAYEGRDVTDLVKIKKYEKEHSFLVFEAKGSFPAFLRKTDEENILKWKNVLNELAGLEFYLSVKNDGSSFTTYLNNGEFGVCSRRLDLKPSQENVFWAAAYKYNVEQKMREIGGNFAIQAELCGPKLNGNKLKLSTNTLYLFDVFDIDKQDYVGFDRMIEIAERLGLETVMILETGLFDYTLSQLQDEADKLEYKPGVKAEGMVLRPKIPIYSETMKQRLSVKVLNNNYKD